ncbi:MAG: shikimate dehydrogenase [Syntrophorhabdaceae bacterium]|nr:shikimate dehydrogenase [Syntrophorhabdaceae bacterium]
MSERKGIFAVAGDPVLHSLSPAVFERAFKGHGIDAVYTRIHSDSPDEIIEIIRQVGIKGINVTSPFKEEIMRYLDGIDRDAEKIGAVNTIVNRDRVLTGYNTDVYGIEKTLMKNQIYPSGKRAIVVGAGGAAKAACFTLKSLGADVVIINRTYKKAEALAKNFGIRAASLGDLDGIKYTCDIYISCLPRKTELFIPHVLKKDAFVMDANYSCDSFVVNSAKRMGYRAIDGMNWLLYQAAKSFEIFTGQSPHIKLMENALKEKVIDDEKRKNISLTGFMGVGKSTVGAYLSKITGFELIEIDSVIEKKTGLSIKEIFERKGETFFRLMEEEEIIKACGLSRKIISCGGGALISKKNKELIRKNSVVIWLWARPETIFKRIYGDDKRPLLRFIKDLNTLKSLMDKRHPYYADVADLIFSTDDKKLEDTWRKIYEEIHPFIKD